MKKLFFTQDSIFCYWNLHWFFSWNTQAFNQLEPSVGLKKRLLDIETVGKARTTLTPACWFEHPLSCPPLSLLPCDPPKEKHCYLSTVGTGPPCTLRSSVGDRHWEFVSLPGREAIFWQTEVTCSFYSVFRKKEKKKKEIEEEISNNSVQHLGSHNTVAAPDIRMDSDLSVQWGPQSIFLTTPQTPAAISQCVCVWEEGLCFSCRARASSVFHRIKGIKGFFMGLLPLTLAFYSLRGMWSSHFYSC